jgi:hypothetical protein
MSLTINCVLSYVENSTLMFVPDTDSDIEKLQKHSVTCNGQFRVKIGKNHKIPDDLLVLAGHHMTITVKCIKYKFTKQVNNAVSTTHAGTRLTLINYKVKT